MKTVLRVIVGVGVPLAAVIGIFLTNYNDYKRDDWYKKPFLYALRDTICGFVAFLIIIVLSSYFMEWLYG